MTDTQQEGGGWTGADGSPTRGPLPLGALACGETAGPGPVPPGTQSTWLTDQSGSSGGRQTTDRRGLSGPDRMGWGIWGKAQAPGPTRPHTPGLWHMQATLLQLTQPPAPHPTLPNHLLQGPSRPLAEAVPWLVLKQEAGPGLTA